MKTLTEELIENKIVYLSDGIYKLNKFKLSEKYLSSNLLEHFLPLVEHSYLFNMLKLEESPLIKEHNSYQKESCCKVCSKSTEFVSWKYGYKNFCCKECERVGRSITMTNKSQEEKESAQLKRKITNLEKYGVENPMSLKEIKDKVVKTQNELYGGTFNLVKAKQTKLEKYGDENYNNTKKQQETMLNTYGVNTTLKIPEKRNAEKAKQTCLEKYGVEFPLLNSDIQQKSLITKLIKYGNDRYVNPQKHSETKQGFTEIQWEEIHNKRLDTIEDKYGDRGYINIDKRDLTCLEKYGVKNISQANIDTTSGYKWKEYTLPSGGIIKYQGYEHYLLDELLLEYKEDEIITERKEIPEIWYIGKDNKTHRYFPDIFIPKTNTIYEVKSEYTLNIDLETNNLKFEAVREAGYNFVLKVYR